MSPPPFPSRFDPNVLKIIDDFWVLVDVDGNGEVDFEEYTDLSLNLQRNMLEYDNKKNKRKDKFNEEAGLLVAKKEWQMDCQGMDYLDYHR